MNRTTTAIIASLLLKACVCFLKSVSFDTWCFALADVCSEEKMKLQGRKMQWQILVSVTFADMRVGLYFLPWKVPGSTAPV